MGPADQWPRPDPANLEDPTHTGAFNVTFAQDGEAPQGENKEPEAWPVTWVSFGNLRSRRT